VSPDEYCRALEAYLTRKNDGHLIRIVGPAFERVRSWAERGVPLKVAYRGIDRCVERYYAKGPRRRPVRIEYCEADILDVFDEWRRAVGVHRAERGEGEDDRPPRRREGLARHLERAIARLTVLRGSTEPGTPVIPEPVITGIVDALDRLRETASHARGETREQVLAELAVLDAELLAAARSAVDDALLAELRREAEADLAAFRDRMPSDQWPRAVDAAVNRALRDRLRLPVLSLE